MTIDKAQLKTLAEAAAKHTPLNGDDYRSPGYDKDCWHDDVCDFANAMSPGVVLAMLAEIDRLEAAAFAMNGARLMDLIDERDQLKAENEALRLAALAAGEFIIHEAEVRGLLDDKGQVSHRHPRRQQAIARIEAAMAKETPHD